MSSKIDLELAPQMSSTITDLGNPWHNNSGSTAKAVTNSNWGKYPGGTKYYDSCNYKDI
jgi:hypothetical protein